MLTCERSRVAIKIRKILLKRRHRKNFVYLHTKDIVKYLIRSGDGSCSCDRYIRAMRQFGEIDYKDPRKNNNIYEIKLKKKFFEMLKEGK